MGNANRWLRVRSLLEHVIEVPPDERRAYLTQACHDDPGICEEVESLLRAQEEAGSFLDSSPDVPSRVQWAGPLGPGARLGHFELLSLIGSGGMGQVYRALDTRLDRHVAVKLLAPALAAQASGRQWLEHEARAISRLTHAHICVLHDVGVATLDDGKECGFLVMELIDGETLAARLTRGALPAHQVITYGRQIAAALSAAHAHGIVHGDLKPSNVILSRAGVKLLDFGLARLRQTPGSSSGGDEAGTFTPFRALAGTLPYMAPEVLEGVEGDERSDVHALGVVLYEMLSGRRPFEAPSGPQLAAAIREAAPLPLPDTLSVPEALRRIIDTCLAKDPADRWQHAHDVTLALSTVVEQPADGGSGVARPGRRLAASVVQAAAVVLAVAAGLVLLRSAPAANSSAAIPHRLMFDASPVRAGQLWSPAVSPNGRMVGFEGGADGGGEFYVRHLDSGDTRWLAAQRGMGCTWSWTWSSDGRSLLYATSSHVMAVNVADGSTRQVASLTPPASTLRAGVSVNARGIILVGGTRLRRVSLDGQDAVPLYQPHPSVTLQVYPSFLPNGTDFVFAQAATDRAHQGVFLGTLGSEQVVRLLPDYSNAMVSDSGHLLFGRDGSVMAQRFDERRRMLADTAAVIASGVQSDDGYTHFAQGTGQSLVYVADEPAPAGELVWYDRDGRALGAVGAGVRYRQIALSPDGRRLVFERDTKATTAHGSSLSILDLARGTTRGANLLMSDMSGFAGDGDPVWAPDGRRVAFTAWVDNQADLYVTDIDSAEPPRRLARLDGMQWAEQWTDDGRFLLFVHTESAAKGSLRALPLQGDPTPIVLVDTPYLNDEPQLSPDGRWLAYVSDESGRPEVYVQPFAGQGERWRLSTDGGGQPKWRGDGGELFFLTPDGVVMSVKFGPGDEARAPRRLFTTPLRPSPNIDEFAVTQDGRRFLVISRAERNDSARLEVISNWPSLLEN